MSKRKNVASRMFFALIVLTLVSCCFLGSTFARYTSSASGTATTEVAKWSISGDWKYPEQSAAGTVKFDKLSPSQDAYNAGTVRTNSTGKVLVATINYDLGVGATLNISTDNFAAQKVTSPSVNTTAENALDEVFKITLYTGNQGDGTGSAAVSNPITLGANKGTLYIFAEVTWTSQDTAAQNGDAIDTWIGQNVTSVSWDLKWIATQNTKTDPVA